MEGLDTNGPDSPTISATAWARSEVLHKVSFQVASGEVVAIVGPSGCGKKHAVAVLGGLAAAKRRRRRIARRAAGQRLNPLTFVFQDFCAVPWVHGGSECRIYGCIPRWAPPSAAP